MAPKLVLLGAAEQLNPNGRFRLERWRPEGTEITKESVPTTAPSTTRPPEACLLHTDLLEGRVVASQSKVERTP